jgi:N-acetyl-gamma-glutamyl-phosphate reductase
MTALIKVGVAGHTGRLGKPLMELLGNHPHAKIVYTESRREGKTGSIYDPDMLFLALPHGESRQYVPPRDGLKVIDLSVDHRGSPDWIYGLPGLNGNKIKDASQIANPGCYATSIILGLTPLREKVHDVQIASTSGISGAGMEVVEDDNFLVYKEGRQHQQIPEIENALGLQDILFAPQKIDNTDRGIISTIFAGYEGNEDLHRLYEEFYRPAPFVRIKNEGNIETRNVIGTNYCDIKVSRYGDRIMVVSALDNIMKGGSGQAVQNFNLMYGFDEKTGLE